MREVDYETAERLYRGGAALVPCIEEPVGFGEWDPVGVDVQIDADGPDLMEAVYRQMTGGNERFNCDRWGVVGEEVAS